MKRQRITFTISAVLLSVLGFQGVSQSVWGRGENYSAIQGQSAPLADGVYRMDYRNLQSWLSESGNTGNKSTGIASCTLVGPWLDDVEGQSGTTANSLVDGCWSARPNSTVDYAWNVCGNGLNSNPSSGPISPNSGNKYFFTEAANGALGHVAELTSSTIDIGTLSNPELSFYYHMFGNAMGTLEIYVFSGSKWKLKGSISGQQQPTASSGWREKRISLAGLSGSVKVKFKAIRANGVNGKIAIDDISIAESSSCPRPKDLTETAVSPTTVDVSWAKGLNETSWQLSWGLKGYVPGDINEKGSASSSVLSYQITGLMNDTSYDIYVRSVCSITDQSLWTGPLKVFTGYCLPSNSGDRSYIKTFIANGDVDQNISNNSGPGLSGTGYSDYSSQQVFVTAGGSIDFSMAIEDTWDSGAQIWVDWNRDLKFDENTEVVYQSSDYEMIHTGTIAIPSTATGSYRMRIASSYIPETGPDSACDHVGQGEYEDYTITIYATTGFVYKNGLWLPGSPVGVCTLSDDVTIINGTVNFTDDIQLQNLNIMSAATLRVDKVLTISGDIVNHGDLIFTSTPAGNGELAAVPASSTISGPITVHRYMQDRRSYRMVSSPLESIGSIHDNWQEGATSSTHDPNPGFGTHITGSKTGADGFDSTESGNPSMFYVPNGSQAFSPITNTNYNKLYPGKPYLLFVRGDRSINLSDPSNTAHSSTTLRTKGFLHTGPRTETYNTVNPGDFVMFGNPYQSTVDVNAIFANPGSSNINTNHYYVYDPSLADHGAYVMVSLPAGTNTTTWSSADNFLQPGQAGQFATAAAGTSSLEFTEASKAPGNHTPTNRAMTMDNMLKVQLYTQHNLDNNGPLHDSFGILFGKGYDNGITLKDANKAMNFGENLAVENSGQYLALEYREMPVIGEMYQLFSTGYNHNAYSFKLELQGLDQVLLYLEDRYAGTMTVLEQGSNRYSFTVDKNLPSSVAPDRFVIVVGQRLGVENHNSLTNVSLYPNPMSGDTFYLHAPQLSGGQVYIDINDISGRKVFEDIRFCNEGKITVSLNKNIASGIYMVTLKHEGDSTTYRLIKE